MGARGANNLLEPWGIAFPIYPGNVVAPEQFIPWGLVVYFWAL